MQWLLLTHSINYCHSLISKACWLIVRLVTTNKKVFAMNTVTTTKGAMLYGSYPHHSTAQTAGSIVYIDCKQHCKKKTLSISITQIICTDNNHQRHNAQCSHASVILKIYGQMLMCQQPGCPPFLFSLIPHAPYWCNALESLQNKNNSRCPIMAGLQNEKEGSLPGVLHW